MNANHPDYVFNPYESVSQKSLSTLFDILFLALTKHLPEEFYDTLPDWEDAGLAVFNENLRDGWPTQVLVHGEPYLVRRLFSGNYLVFDHIRGGFAVVIPGKLMFLAPIKA